MFIGEVYLHTPEVVSSTPAKVKKITEAYLTTHTKRICP